MVRNYSFITSPCVQNRRHRRFRMILISNFRHCVILLLIWLFTIRPIRVLTIVLRRGPLAEDKDKGLVEEKNWSNRRRRWCGELGIGCGKNCFHLNLRGKSSMYSLTGDATLFEHMTSRWYILYELGFLPILYSLYIQNIKTRLFPFGH